MEMKRILVVEDDKTSRKLTEGMLKSLGYQPLSAATAQEALDTLEASGQTVDLVLLDVLLPDLDGFEIARRIRQHPDFADLADLPLCMVTSLNEQADRLRAVEVGANDFIAKPIERIELKLRVASLLKLKESQDTLKRQNLMLEERVLRRTLDLQNALNDVLQAKHQVVLAHKDTIHRLAVASEYKDHDTADHLHRMSRYVQVLAEGLDLPSGEVELLVDASPMHDVGKIGIPEGILFKPGKLDPEEWAVMRQHSEIGARILAGSPSELLKAGEVIALTHHERWDGKGYPRGLAGERIPLWGRICAVADVWDALTTKRPYKEPFPVEKAFALVREGRGTQFDPTLVDLFFERQDEILAVQGEFEPV